MLVPSHKRDAITEAHSVVAVTVLDPSSERSDAIPDLFADSADAPLSWTTRRAGSLRPGIAGTDVYLALVVRPTVAAQLAQPVGNASLLCTTSRLNSIPMLLPGRRR